MLMPYERIKSTLVMKTDTCWLWVDVVNEYNIIICILYIGFIYDRLTPNLQIFTRYDIEANYCRYLCVIYTNSDKPSMLTPLFFFLKI